MADFEVIVENVWTYIKPLRTIDPQLLKDLDRVMSYQVAEYARFRKTFVEFSYSLLDRQNLKYPTGLYSDFHKVAEYWNLSYDLIDKRISPNLSNKIPICAKPLRDYQQEVVENAIKTERGIIKVATGGGKTVIAANIIANLNLKTMFIVNSIDLLEQASDEFSTILGIKIGKVGGGYCNIEQINVCTIQTLYSALGLEYEAADKEYFLKEIITEDVLTKKDEIRNLIRESEVIMIDECFSPDTQILIDYDKQVTIKEIYKNKFIDHVISFNHSTNTYEKKRILNKMRTLRNDKWYKIKIKIGENIITIRTTKTHKFWIKNKGYVEVVNLQLGDILKFNSSNPKNVKICDICGKEWKSGVSLKSHKAYHLNKGAFQNPKFFENRSKNSEYIKKISDRMKINNPSHDPKIRKKIRKSWRENWRNKSEEEKTKVRQNWINAPKKVQGKEWKPTKFEQKILDLNIPELAYIGDGKFWITIGKRENGKKWSKNPDFKVRNQRKVIEVGDIVYWHTLEEIEKVKKAYESKNFECLYLTNNDFENENWENTKGKIYQFIYNHDEGEIISITYCYSERNSYKKLFKYNLEVEDNHNYFANNILVSNCHHLRADSYVNMMSNAENSYFKLGLSGTPYKLDSTDLLLQAYAGKEIANISASYLIDRKFLVCPEIYFLDPNDIPEYKYIKGSFRTAYNNWIIDNADRNRMILDCVRRFAELNKTTLITVSQIRHGETLSELITNNLKGINVEFIKGEVKKEKRKEMLNAIRERKLNVLVGTSLADEGLDLPALDAAIIAGGGKSMIKTLQRVGRTLRPYPNVENNIKEKALIVDFYDHLRYLTGQSRKRMKIYQQEPRFKIFKSFK